MVVEDLFDERRGGGDGGAREGHSSGGGVELSRTYGSTVGGMH